MGKTAEKTIKSRQRVQEHGEVLTPEHIVNAMLDLVKPETERIDSRFLEPACGTGNFLAEILQRKLRVVKARYARVQLEYSSYSTRSGHKKGFGTNMCNWSTLHIRL